MSDMALGIERVERLEQVQVKASYIYRTLEGSTGLVVLPPLVLER